MVFNDAVMRQRLPKDVYKSLTETIQTGKMIDVSIANVVANAMKDWATEKGATHYTHWFQPLTSVTAEKHDSFISPIGGDKVVMEFSGKELIKGEVGGGKSCNADNACNGNSNYSFHCFFPAFLCANTFKVITTITIIRKMMAVNAQ